MYVHVALCAYWRVCTHACTKGCKLLGAMAVLLSCLRVCVITLQSALSCVRVVCCNYRTCIINHHYGQLLSTQHASHELSNVTLRAGHTKSTDDEAHRPVQFM